MRVFSFSLVWRMCLVMGMSGWTWAAGAATAPVSIDAKAASVQTCYFDPQSPPKQMPPLKPGEAAVTQSNFSVQAKMNVTIVKQQTDDTGRCTATMRVDSVSVTTGLNIILWLPNGASDKLRAHEQGHQHISEQFYRDAAAAARGLAKQRIGQVLTGEGADCRKAAQAAMSQSMDKLNGDWMTQISAAAQAVQERYDALTDHGRNDLEEDQAIERAIKSARSSQSHTSREE